MESELWNDRKWLKLLHYQKKLTGSYESRADGKEFFIDPVGKYSPKKELLALINSLDVNHIEDQHIVCRFPARVQWLLSKTVDQIEVNFSKCPAFQEFYRNHQTEKVYLVFSSYYLESPASTFGHTFLRFGKSSHISNSKSSELLDMAISYGANYTTSNPFIYSVMGIFGGFQGTFTSVPYFYKVREYNDFESRDLWSYELNLDSQQISFLLAHLWEIGNTYFDYFYFDENCSFYLLALLEAVNPDWHLLSRLPFYIIPVDTLKSLNDEPGIVREIHFRPSIRKKAHFDFNSLSRSEQKIYKKIIDTKDLSLLDLRLSSFESRAKVADALMTYIDFAYIDQVSTQKGSEFDWKNQLLSKRSKIEHIGLTATPEVADEEIPHIGHKTVRSQLRYSYHENLKNSLGFGYRFALHDLLDYFPGQSKTSSIEFVNANFRYYSDLSKLRVERINLIQIENFYPWTELQKPKSLRLSFGFKTMDEELCFLCVAPNLEFGIGATFNLGQNNILNFLIENEYSYHSHYERHNFEWGIGPSISFLRWWGTFASSRVDLAYRRYMTNREDQTLLIHETRLHLGVNFAIGFNNIKRRNSFEHSLMVNYFL